uniref:VLRF1 domain-containing protein n=1 Tax=Romanomermis culicivorax TaxID=13658 RepID=A0A915IHA9_ROMCU
MAKSAHRDFYNIFHAENGILVENLVKNCRKLFIGDQRDDIQNQQEVEFSNTTTIVDQNQNFTCRLCNILDFDSSSDQNLLPERDILEIFDPYPDHTYQESCSSDDDDEESSNSERQILQKLNTTGRSFFVSHDNSQVFSCFKAILGDNDSSLNQILQNFNWSIFALAGGHFAASYFEKEKCVAHKTLHRYVVRAKQGGAQAARDGKQSQNKPKSAGANLRRYNENMLCKDVEDVLEQWSDNLQKSNLIFLRYPSYYKKLFFRSGSPSSLNEKLCKLDKNDPRVRNIPFNTKKPTLQEMERIHRKLSCIILHGPKEQFLQNLRIENPIEPKVIEKVKIPIKTKKNVNYYDDDDIKSVKNDDSESVKDDNSAQSQRPPKIVNKSDDVIKNDVVLKSSLSDDQVRNLYTCLKLGDCDRLRLIIDQMLDQ